MRLVSGLTALLAGAAFAIGMLDEIRPAAAQGGIVCAYGTSTYRRCCRESYRNRQNLGPSARARDIDACMNGETREEKHEERRDERREDRRDERREDRRDERRDDKAQKPARSDSGPAALTRIRRLDCTADGCQDGCATDEVVISAFCGPTALPSPNGDRDVQCLGQGNPERPTVLVCAGK
jgi:hypothetical protein